MARGVQLRGRELGRYSASHLPPGAGGTEICLKTGANPKNTAPCDGPVTGNFGFLNFTEYGDEDGNGTLCTGGGTDRLARNIARGIDHFLGIFGPFPSH